MIVIILVQGAAISQLSSVQCAVSFKVIPLLSFLLVSALFLTEIFLDRPLCVSKLTRFLVCLIEFGIHFRNLRLFLLVRICRSVWPPRQQSPLLIYRDFWVFGHDFSENLQFVHDDSPYRINSTLEIYLLWRWACKTLNEVLRSSDGLSDTLRRSFHYKNNCTLQGAAGSHIVGISYRISHANLGIT